VGQLIGPASEVNYTGKKMDPETGLYYFNQRYYDPSLGRFLTEDPAGQGLNPYAYAGNSPLMYVDPDGEFFWALAVVMFKAAATSAAINVTAQLVMTGQVNWDSVGQSALSGALSGGLSFGVGEMMGHATSGLGKTLAHGISGGISSMASGGSFGSGFVSGAVGNMVSEASMGAGMFEQAGIAGLAGGVTSMASGGDFANGFQSGAYNVLYNHYAGGLNDE
jgi:RHS repeat-associated protein